MIQKKVLIFDVDGTLFDTKFGIFSALEDVFIKYGFGYFDRTEGMKYIGPPIKESLIKYIGISEEVAEKATEYYRDVYIKHYIGDSKPYSGAIQVLTDLKNMGYVLAIATMKTRCQLDCLLETTSIKNLFDHFETALENGELGKAEMIRKITSKERVSSAVMIGDTLGDKTAAEESGVEFLGVTYGYGFRPGEDYDFRFVNNIAEIVSAVK